MSEVRIKDGKIVARVASGFMNPGPPDGYYKLVPLTPEESRLAKFEKMEFLDPEKVLREMGPPPPGEGPTVILPPREDR